MVQINDVDLGYPNQAQYINFTNSLLYWVTPSGAMVLVCVNFKCGPDFMSNAFDQKTHKHKPMMTRNISIYFKALPCPRAIVLPSSPSLGLPLAELTLANLILPAGE